MFCADDAIITFKLLQIMDTIFQIIVLIMSVVVHEVSHGYAANYLGDSTARYAGRLTLNPIRHIDLWGSIVIPLLLVFSKAGFVIGWAKPVPVNPYNLRGGVKGEALVAAAGPLSNIFLAVAFGLLIRFGVSFQLLSPVVINIAAVIVFINLVLAIFNLMPIPPLDGSKILLAFLPNRFLGFQAQFERFGFFLVLFFVFFLWQFFIPIISFLFSIITGVVF